MSHAPDESQLLYFSAYGQDVLVGNPENEDDTHLVTREHPLGYEFFAHAFNSEGLQSTASYLDESGAVVSIGSALEATDVISDEEDSEITVSTSRMEQMEKMVWHTAISAAHQREKIEQRRAGQRKERNFGRKQTQKLNKRGLGRVRKQPDLPTTYPVMGSSSVAPPEEAMAEMD
ncbi:uncharacterized protein HD556DRAFT_1310677 [Suillus plorans]|uniref:Uncharacterized protein n=1 Tax=Suillus plorans TaxID=116603 RepID=A0A9P7DF18_9AGAM|nr:uncharacterized protein HD556DRAFT_1310677 [Suillus plorans]KAG1790264.1 hypothetical protein HD556DRAFT_1310677 [Suillus plorans]